MTVKIEEILKNREEAQKNLEEIRHKIVDLETQGMVISNETGIPFYLGRYATFIPRKFFDATLEYDDASDQKIMQEFRDQFEEEIWYAEDGAGIWQPSRNC